MPFAYEKKGRPFIFMTISQNDGPNGRSWPTLPAQ